MRTLKFTLTGTTQDGAYNTAKKVNETVYHYEAGPHDKVAFHAHPTEPFTWVRVTGKHKHYIRLVNKFVEQAMKSLEEGKSILDVQIIEI